MVHSATRRWVQYSMHQLHQPSPQRNTDSRCTLADAVCTETLRLMQDVGFALSIPGLELSAEPQMDDRVLFRVSVDFSQVWGQFRAT